MVTVRESEGRLRDLVGSESAPRCGTSLDPRTDALVRLSALIATGTEPAAYADAVRSALEQGVPAAQVVDTLVAVSPTIGTARVVSASRGISLALGYDMDGAIEGPS